MFSAVGGINWLGVGVAAVASSIIGGLWFAALFAKPYAVALGRENAPKEKPAPIFVLGPFVCGLITTVTSALLIDLLDIRSIGSAIQFGALVGFGFLAATTVNTAINPNIPRPLLYGLVSGPYFFIASIVSCVILVAMR